MFGKKINTAVLVLLIIALLSGCGRGASLQFDSQAAPEVAAAAPEAPAPVPDTEPLPSEEETPEAALPETVSEKAESPEDTAPESETEPPEVTTTTPSEEPAEETETTANPHIGQKALAVVPNYVNVREGPSTEEAVVGKIYNYCAADILHEVNMEDGHWYLINSGNVTGFIKSDFFVVGEEAEALREEVGVLKGVVTEDYLRVRSEPDLSNPDNVFTYYERGTEVLIDELTEDGWAKITSDESSTGFVYAECLDIRRDFKTAITLEEEAAEIARREAAEEAARKAQEEYEAAMALQEQARQQALALQEEANRQASIAAEQAAQEEAARKAQEDAARQAQEQANQAQQAIDAASSDALAATRNAVVAYGLQFVGNPYVHGGRSLVTGTDCSGFTALVYANFGYYLSYTPAGQAEQGIRVDLNSLLPGDLLFYSNSYKYLGHVAMYIGNGQIVHAGTEATGIFVGSAYYRDPLFAVRIIY